MGDSLAGRRPELICPRYKQAGETDLNKVGHGFPATVIMPDGLEIKVGWEEKRDSDGVPYGLSQAIVQLNSERELLINVVDEERATQILGYRQDDRFKVRLDKDGSEGSWAHVHEWSGGTSRNEESVFVFQNIGSQQFGFILKRNGEGQWKLARAEEY